MDAGLRAGFVSEARKNGTLFQCRPWEIEFLFDAGEASAVVDDFRREAFEVAQALALVEHFLGDHAQLVVVRGEMRKDALKVCVGFGFETRESVGETFYICGKILVNASNHLR